MRGRVAPKAKNGVCDGPIDQGNVGIAFLALFAYFV
jgi:hypothetical protein